MYHYIVKIPYQNPEEFDNERDAAEAVVGSETYIEEMDANAASESLDECYGKIEICGREYWASEILRGCDEDLYYEVIDDEKRAMAENDQDYIEDQILRISPNDYETFNGVRVTCIEVDDDDDIDEESEFDEEGFGEIFTYTA